MKNCKEIFKKFNGVDAVVLITAPNTYYVTEYESTFAFVVLSENGGFYLTDTRYIEEAKIALSDGMECISISYRDCFNKINEILDKLNAKTIGFENKSITYDTYINLSASLKDKKLVGIEDDLLAIRSVKTDDELKLIKHAAGINDRSFADLLTKIKEGITEREVAYELEYNFKRFGADGLAFDTIVAFGDNTSKPHAHISEKRLEKGMPITIDFGCTYKGYCSDITRTFAFGEPSDDFKELYNLVLDANLLGISKVKADVPARNVDLACRDLFKQHGLDKYFIHGTGHGVGIDIHEAPTLNPNSDEILKPNMVVTVEPGLYIEGKHGVRVEDLAIVTNDGCEIFSHTNKKLLIL